MMIEKKSNLENWRNRLVIFEGADESGKTSVANLLVDMLNNMDIETAFTFQPGDSNWGPLAPTLRSLCKDKRWNLHPLANFFAFQLDRVEQTSKVIVPALAEGKTVVSDRWNYSTYAYQMHGKQLITKYNMPEDVLNWLMEAAITSRNPDVVFYFPEKLNVGRKDDKNDAFDNASNSFFDRVHNAYEELCEKNDNWIRVLPGKSAEETLEKVLVLMDEYYKKSIKEAV
jgi:dTMP kinase